MKRYLLAIAAVVCVGVLVSFTTAGENNAKFACTWFYFDNPADGTGDTDDFPLNLTEATTVGNYVEITPAQAITLCPQTKELCAICAEVDVNGNPILTTGSTIRTHLNTYFSVSDPALRVSNPSFIKEKIQL